LKELTSSAEGLLPGFEFAGTLIGRATVGQSHYMPEVLADIQSAVDGGAKPEAALHDALAARMESTVAARRRQITEDLAGKVKPNELKRVIDEFDRAIANINFQFEVTRFFDRMSSSAETSKPSEPETPTQRIAPDEDLRGSPR